MEAAPLPDGEAELRAQLAAAPGDAVARSWLGYYLALWGAQPAQRDEALALLAGSAAAHPGDAELQANLGLGGGTSGSGRRRESVALEAALARDPGRAIDRFRLAIVLARREDRARALELARTAMRLRPAASWSPEARRRSRRSRRLLRWPPDRRLEVPGVARCCSGRGARVVAALAGLVACRGR